MVQLVLYLLGMAVTGYLTMIYPKTLMITIFALEIVIFIPGLLYSISLARKIKVSIRIPVPVSKKEQPVDVNVLVENRSNLPMFNGKIFLHIKNHFHEKTEKEKIRIQADRKNSAVCKCRLYSSGCGKIDVSILKVYAGDPLGIFYFRVKISDKSASVAVMPELMPMYLGIDTRDWDIISDSDEYDTFRGGDDPSEIFQIRSYRRGDRMQSIYWKMTARSRDLMVREFSKPVYCAVALFLDMYTDDKCLDFVEADEYLEKALAVSWGLLEVQCSHMVVWYDGQREKISRMRIDTMEHIYELIEQLFQVLPYHTKIDLEELYHQEFPYHTYCLSYLLNLDLNLWEGGSFSCRDEKKLLQ